MWLIAGGGAIFSLLLLPATAIVARNAAFEFIFALIFQLWLGFFAMALWKNRQAAASAAGVNRLVTAGVYSIVRHPIYFADILMAWGIFLFFPNLNVLLAAFWITLVFHGWMGLEEEALSKKFGKKFSDYSRKVPKLVPRL